MGGHHHHHHRNHSHDHDHSSKTYDHLLKRLDANAVTIPNTPLVKQALSLLFNQEEAELASKMPGEFATAATVSKLTAVPLQKTATMLAPFGEYDPQIAQMHHPPYI